MMNFTTIGLNMTLLTHAQIKNYEQYQNDPQCCKVCCQRVIFHVKTMKMQNDMKIGFDESWGNFTKYIYIYLMIETR
jgi:hypothetical protein